MSAYRIFQFSCLERGGTVYAQYLTALTLFGELISELAQASMARPLQSAKLTDLKMTPYAKTAAPTHRSWG